MEPLIPLTITRLLVPLDGSHLAEVSVAPAITLAQRLHAPITLLHVLEHRAPPVVHSDRHLTSAADAELYLHGIASRVSDAGVSVDQHIHANPERDVAASIAGHAREFHTDLIVLCTHGQGGPREWMTGSLAQRVIRQAEVPILLVRPHAVRPLLFAPHTIVAALDRTAASEAILPAALALARAFSASLQLVTTVPTRSTVTGEQGVSARLSPLATTAALDLEATMASTYLQRITDALAPADLPIRSEVVRGDPVQTVADHMGSRPDTVLALATHGRSGFDALWSASIGSRLVHRISGPLLLVRPTAEQGFQV